MLEQKQKPQMNKTSKWAMLTAGIIFVLGSKINPLFAIIFAFLSAGLFYRISNRLTSIKKFWVRNLIITILLSLVSAFLIGVANGLLGT